MQEKLAPNFSKVEVVSIALAAIFVIFILIIISLASQSEKPSHHSIMESLKKREEKIKEHEAKLRKRH